MTAVTVCILSSDTRLYLLCEHILTGIPDRKWNICRGSGYSRPEADVYVWDFDPATLTSEIASHIDELRTIFVVHRKDVPAFRELLPGVAAGILLKPVNRITLQSFIENTVARLDSCGEESQSAVIHSLRLDRDELLQRLLEANVRLQEYDQDRTSFLARTVHDFRAPLTAISGYCGLLLSQQVGPVMGEQLEILQRMNNSINRLNRMAAAMFQLSIGSRLEVRSDIRPGDIEASIEQALHEAIPLAREKNISITTQVEPPGQPLCFDATQIEQVLVNLLDNACKFTPKNGYVEIHAYPSFWDRRSGAVRPEHVPDERRQTVQRPNAYRVEISDSGPGVPAGRLDKIFEEYTSYDGSEDRAGAGLGLAICKMIMHGHRGRVFATSSGRGVTFSFLLPFRSAAAELAEVPKLQADGMAAQ